MSENNNFFKRQTIPPFPLSEPLKSQEIPLPTQIGPYRIEALLEKGGMSVLYLGTHPETQTPITIKVLSQKFLAHPEMKSHFLNEAEIIALADHPNIVKLYGYGEWEGGLYIAMEFIQGVSLRQYLLQNPMTLKRALEMVLEIAYALCHLHTHGVIHRDLKPENILVNENGQIKVIDFGIAQLIDPLELVRVQDETGKKRLVGTPVYMSPEQRENPENVSYPSDIYSLGIIAYELVLGKLSQGLVHLSLMPKGLQKILGKALQTRVSDRYMDIVDFITDLSSYVHSPQFDKEKKIGDQAGEWFEKFQQLQHQLVPQQSVSIANLNVGLVIHRPLNFSAVYGELFEKENLLAFAESSIQETESLLQLLYFKGLLDSLHHTHFPLEEWAAKLNTMMHKGIFKQPLPFGLVHWDLLRDQIDVVSCGFGPLWKIDAAHRIELFNSPNMALGLAEDLLFQSQSVHFLKGERILLCPLSSAHMPFTAEQFSALLSETAVFQPQKQAETIYRKAKSLQNRYFDEHPFLIVCLERI